MAAERWLVVGLSNPEAEYAGTRHNVGADIVRLLAARLGASFKPHKAGARIADTYNRASGGAGGTALSLVIPSGYMNESGGPVQRAAAFYKTPHQRLVVVHDDLDLAVGTLRLKRGGGTAGHRGLRDIQQRTGSADFYRVRVGIGRPPGRMDPADYVLKRFRGGEREEIDIVAERAADAVLDLIALGLEAAQNRHH
ncbi:MAG TPA: aminoacyl-tRNA hydrolase [Egibacteraceae bacterium]|nr:aminoacyl-tRNA hydrolase [Actinomycetota bacterium]HWB72633.1 aminoacyl-tRNA hydrolase [Egibacteraceae bacterium]